MPNPLEEHAPAQMVGGKRVKAPSHNVPLKTADKDKVEEDIDAEDERQVLDTKFEEFERLRRAQASQKQYQNREPTMPKADFTNNNVGGQRNAYNQPRLHNHMTYRGTPNE